MSKKFIINDFIKANFPRSQIKSLMLNPGRFWSNPYLAQVQDLDSFRQDAYVEKATAFSTRMIVMFIVTAIINIIVKHN